jgi:hypothetical protein
MEYRKLVQCNHALTQAELNSMTRISRALLSDQVKEVALAEHMQYAISLCRFAQAVVIDYPTCKFAASKNGHPWWVHGDYSSNCVWFAVVRHGMDAARRFLSYVSEMESPDGHSCIALPARIRQDIQDRAFVLLGVLTYLRDVAFVYWVDAPAHPKHYSPATLRHLYLAVRACALYMHGRALKTLLLWNPKNNKGDANVDYFDAKTARDSAQLLETALRCLEMVPSKLSLVVPGVESSAEFENPIGVATKTQKALELVSQTEHATVEDHNDANPASYGWQKNVLGELIETIALFKWYDNRVTNAGYAVASLKTAVEMGFRIEDFHGRISEMESTPKYKPVSSSYWNELFHGYRQRIRESSVFLKGAPLLDAVVCTADKRDPCIALCEEFKVYHKAFRFVLGENKG